MRIVIADDSALMREGIAAFLRRAGLEVVAQASSGEELLRAVEEHEPDMAIIDIRMPPTYTDEGLRAAQEIRAAVPGDRDRDPLPARGDRDRDAVARGAPGRLGYLLKDRVGDIDEFAATLRGVAAGGSALDPQIVTRLLAIPRDDGPLASLSAREREVLALVAEGRSNKAIGDRLELSQRGVQKHVTASSRSSASAADEDDNRRILAVLQYLRPAANRTRRVPMRHPHAWRPRVGSGAWLGPSRSPHSRSPPMQCRPSSTRRRPDRAAVVVIARDVVRRYGEGDTAVDALRGVSVDIAAGSLTAVMGPSGSGKSTLMHILAGLDKPTAGEVSVAGVDIGSLDDTALTKLRRDHIGFIFQFFNLLPMLTAAENIALPLKLAGVARPGWLAELVAQVGLADRLSHRPSELSGGQQQRVAVARALVSGPSVMFADEPTGNLDSKTSGEILGLLRDSVDRLGQTTVMVTHDAHAAAIADRVLFLADGDIVRDLGPSSAHEILATLEEVSGR